MDEKVEPSCKKVWRVRSGVCQKAMYLSQDNSNSLHLTELKSWKALKAEYWSQKLNIDHRSWNSTKKLKLGSKSRDLKAGTQNQSRNLKHKAWNKKLKTKIK